MTAPRPGLALLALALATATACREAPAAPAQSRPDEAAAFRYLRFLPDALLAEHAIPLALRQPSGFRPAGPVHHTPTFNGLPFRVSLAAYLADEQVLMVHAETLADGSGALDYSKLEPTRLAGMSFRFRDVCAPLSPEVIREEHDLAFLADNGFDPQPALFLRQFLMTSTDRNAEYVLSYGRRVPGCGVEVVTPDFIERLEAEIATLVKLEPAP